MAKAPYGKLVTETPNPHSRRIDTLGVEGIVEMMAREDALVAGAVRKVKPSIVRAVKYIVRSFESGGRLFFVGAGTSGRLGVVEAAECPPTFDTPPRRVQAIIAGGRRAFSRSIEGAEDRASSARAAIRTARIGARDTVVGIAASGITPFVREALREAKRRRAQTALLTCNRIAKPAFVDVLMAPIVGPELISGSTRLKAGTATKMVLNMLTTVSMIRMGKVYQNLMVDLQPKSRKLMRRACRILMTLGGVSSEVEARRLLGRAHRKTKVALVMAKKNMPYAQAQRLVKKHGGFLRKVLAIGFVCFFSTTAFAQDKSFSNPWRFESVLGDASNTDMLSLNGLQEKPESQEESQRRALPPAFPSPPFPSGEYQGYPLIGLPPDDSVYPLMQYLCTTSLGKELKESGIKLYGWFNVSGNLSTATNSNTPDSYWIVPNKLELDQLVFRVERQLDSAQTDHVDVGFRSSFLYGIDYRYMTAGSWFSHQLLKRNNLYGFDPTEQYIDVYIPRVAEGLILRLGRWIACPDIETQFAPDNYMATHSLLFTFDTYTQTGFMATVMLNKQWTVQAAIHAGTDMAPWYQGATPTGMFGVRWVSLDNRDSIYLVLNDINNAEFRTFTEDGQPSGHDNFNYLVGTWQHKFSENIHTKTESYFMWQRNAFVGGTPSLGPVESYGGGGGLGDYIPGITLTYGVVNYTMFKFSDKDFITVRNEVWRDNDGERSGFPGTYTSHAVGLTHNFSSILQVRPEIGYYRNWENPAFDLGTKQGMWLLGFDTTLRF